MKILFNYLAVSILLFSFCTVSFGQGVEQEKISFSIPKNIYFGGEKVWIKSQSLVGDKPSESKIIYAELLNRYNESVAIAKMPLEEGESFNYLELPSNLPSDNYLLRVFTRISPYQNIEDGLKQQFVTVFNKTVPPTVVAERKSEGASQESDQIVLSKQVNEMGTTLGLELPKEMEITGMSIAFSNPFLNIQGMVSSAQAYESIDQRDLVPELYGHVIEAKVEKAAIDTTKLYYLSLHGEKSALFTDRPDADGSMYIDAGGMKNWDFLVAQADGNESLLDFSIVSPSPVTHFKSGFTFPELLISTSDQEFLQELLKGGQIEGYFVNKYDETEVPVVTGFTVDRTYLLDDYTRFETVGTVIKEYVPEIRIRNVQKKKEFRALDEVLDGGFDSNPLMLVDALPVFDSDLLAAFNPANFKRLDVLTRTFFLNEENFPGVMSFSSYKNDFGGFPIPSNGIYLDYAGVQPKIVSAEFLFTPPTESQKIMDWRTVLYWSDVPNSETPTSSMEIKLPNLKGKYQITLKSKTPQGDAMEYVKTFEVK
ncbi:hypothetical protein SAMN04489724_0156 [Algoriphagus locisalis]|uniref:MG2 domain-containing protein n=1 Tax=Algoriphagus locisalis TaxID=305507 RepID=A0A1I7E6L8_9BACT|nr:hypothetical protein [Algoriphagus locisalis]SFU19576.1 hypothetical protein SAMN04489724_0156 [Algoriphagus locisalis]